MPMVPDDVAVDDEKAPGPLVDVDVAVEVPGPDAMAVFVLPSVPDEVEVEVEVPGVFVELDVGMSVAGMELEMVLEFISKGVMDVKLTVGGKPDPTAQFVVPETRMPHVQEGTTGEGEDSESTFSQEGPKIESPDMLVNLGSTSHVPAV